MTTARDLDSLRKQLFTLDDTRRALIARLELTVKALALTLDAQASTQQCIDLSTANGHVDDRRRWENLQWQREAERYRAVLGLLVADGDDSADPSDGGRSSMRPNGRNGGRDPMNQREG